MFPTAKWRKWLVGLVIVSLVAAVVAHRALLTAVGNLMAVSDDHATAEWGVLTPESSSAGELALDDLFRAGEVKRIVVMRPSPTLAVRELARRGVQQEDDPIHIFQRLGVPSDRLTVVAAGEGGTTESTLALDEWCRSEHPDSVLVVVSPTHGRRYRRALRRAWRCDRPFPAIRVTRYTDFRAEDWWQSRRTLREGIVELEKLLLDYAQHPLPAG